jgi:hypothetical protein
MLLDSAAAAGTASEEETGERSRPPMAVAVETNGEDVSLVPHGQSVRQWACIFACIKRGWRRPVALEQGRWSLLAQNLTERRAIPFAAGLPMHHSSGSDEQMFGAK